MMLVGRAGVAGEPSTLCHSSKLRFFFVSDHSLRCKDLFLMTLGASEELGHGRLSLADQTPDQVELSLTSPEPRFSASAATIRLWHVANSGSFFDVRWRVHLRMGSSHLVVVQTVCRLLCRLHDWHVRSLGSAPMSRQPLIAAMRVRNMSRTLSR